MKCLLMISLLFCMACNTNNNMDIQGHRGCRGLLPENSIPAFQKAIDLGVTTLELDVVVSKDMEIVVSHEPFMNHEIALDLFGNKISEADEMSYNLYSMPYDSIKLYDCGSKPHPRFPDQKKIKVAKPLLSEVIDMAESASEHQIHYNIEIKSSQEYDKVYTPEVSEYVRLVIALISKKAIVNRTTLQSFDLRALEAIHHQNSNIKTALLVDEIESITSKLKELSFKTEIISPYFELIDANQVSDLQKQGFKVIPWTVNAKDDIKLMIGWKVDGIISDYPDRVLELYKVKISL